MQPLKHRKILPHLTLLPPHQKKVPLGARVDCLSAGMSVPGWAVSGTDGRQINTGAVNGRSGRC